MRASAQPDRWSGWAGRRAWRLARHPWPAGGGCAWVGRRGRAGGADAGGRVGGAPSVTGGRLVCTSTANKVWLAALGRRRRAVLLTPASRDRRRQLAALQPLPPHPRPTFHCTPGPPSDVVVVGGGGQTVNARSLSWPRRRRAGPCRRRPPPVTGAGSSQPCSPWPPTPNPPFTAPPAHSPTWSWRVTVGRPSTPGPSPGPRHTLPLAAAPAPPTPTLTMASTAVRAGGSGPSPGGGRGAHWGGWHGRGRVGGRVLVPELPRPPAARPGVLAAQPPRHRPRGLVSKTCRPWRAGTPPPPLRRPALPSDLARQQLWQPPPPPAPPPSSPPAAAADREESGVVGHAQWAVAAPPRSPQSPGRARDLAHQTTRPPPTPVLQVDGLALRRPQRESRPPMAGAGVGGWAGWGGGAGSVGAPSTPRPRRAAGLYPRLCPPIPPLPPPPPTPMSPDRGRCQAGRRVQEEDQRRDQRLWPHWPQLPALRRGPGRLPAERHRHQRLGRGQAGVPPAQVRLHARHVQRRRQGETAFEGRVGG